MIDNIQEHKRQLRQLIVDDMNKETLLDAPTLAKPRNSTAMDIMIKELIQVIRLHQMGIFIIFDECVEDSYATSGAIFVRDGRWFMV